MDHPQKSSARELLKQRTPKHRHNDHIFCTGNYSYNLTKGMDTFLYTNSLQTFFANIFVNITQSKRTIISLHYIAHFNFDPKSYASCDPQTIKPVSVSMCWFCQHIHSQFNLNATNRLLISCILVKSFVNLCWRHFNFSLVKLFICDVEIGSHRSSFHNQFCFLASTSDVSYFIREHLVA